MTSDAIPKSQRAAVAFLGRIVRAAGGGLWELDCRQDRVYYSPSWAELLGIDPSSLGDSLAFWLDRVHPEDRRQLESRMARPRQGLDETFAFDYRIRHEDGRFLWVRTTARATRDRAGSLLYLTGHTSDISELRALEKKLFAVEFFDDLTGLANRALLLQRIQSGSTRDPHKSCLWVLGLDRSRDLRDSLGLAAFDRLLAQIARYLRDLFDGDQTVARLSGSRFAILLTGKAVPADPEQAAASLLSQFPSRSFEVGGRELAVTASLGWIDDGSGYDSAEEMLQDALTAFENARLRGSEQVLRFDPKMRTRIHSVLRIEQEVRSGLGRGRIRPVFHPVVALDTGQIVGFEALGRLYREDGSTLPPQVFLPAARNIGKTGEVDRMILRDVARVWRRWRRESQRLSGLFLTVNASPELLTQPDLIPWLDATLREVGMNPAHLVLEVTESAIDWAPEEVAEGLRHVRSLGVGLALDGLGRGRLALDRFERLPIELVKLDHTSLAHPRQESTLVPLLQLTKNLGLRVIVQGVETRAQAHAMRSLGVPLGQGFFFSDPLGEDEASKIARHPDALFRPDPGEGSGNPSSSR